MEAVGDCATYPCLVMSASDVEIMRESAAGVEWMKDGFSTLKRGVDEWRARGLSIPAQGGLWTHNYICPGGAQLVYNPDEPHRHLCPDDGKYYEGPLLDGAWREFTHDRNIKSALDAAIVYTVTGDAAYAEYSREILIRYAKNYYKYPAHGGPAGLGRITGQSLNEAVWLIDAATTFDLIAGAPCMSERDRENIFDKLFIPAAQHIEGYPFGVHNIQVWSDVAMLMAGLLAGKSHFVDIATADLRLQIDQGIRAEGFWYETSVGYHTYAMRPFMALAAVCRNRGLDVCDSPKLKKYFTVLNELAMPDMTLPSINDGSRGNTLAGAVAGPVTARYAFDDPSLDSFIKTVGDIKNLYSGHPFTTFYYRAPDGDVPDWDAPSKSSHLPDAGLTVLRRDGKYALIKYNPECRSHDHYDRLGIIFHDGARELFPDPGTPLYGHPLYRGWYQRTEAHNTLMVDGKQQARVGCAPLRFYDEPAFTAVTVQCNTVYDGVTMRRTIALAAGALIDITVADSADQHTYDWFLHANVPLDDVASAAPAVADAAVPNDQITITSSGTLAQPETITWPPLRPGDPEAYTALLQCTPWQPGELLRGRATAFLTDTTQPILIWRQRGKTATFAAVTSGSPLDITLTATAARTTLTFPGGTLTINTTGEITFK